MECYVSYVLFAVVVAFANHGSSPHIDAMVKRRVTHGSDHEDLDAEDTPDSKRARTVSTEDEEDVTELALPKRVSKRAAKGKGKARNDDEEDEDEDEGSLGMGQEEEEEKPNVGDDEKFEQENEEKIRAAIEAKRKVHGVSERFSHFLLQDPIYPSLHRA